MGSFEALLADPKVDAVVLATPHSLHTQAGHRRGRGGQACVLRKAICLDESAEADAQSKQRRKLE